MMSLKEVYTEAGTAFMNTVIGSENLNRLLQLQSTYNFTNIQHCIAWLLDQMHNSNSVTLPADGGLTRPLEETGSKGEDQVTIIGHVVDSGAAGVLQLHPEDMLIKSEGAEAAGPSSAKPADCFADHIVTANFADFSAEEEGVPHLALGGDGVDSEGAGEEDLPLTAAADENGQFRCQVCQKVYLNRYKLMAHYRIHKNRTPHLCNICNKTFKKKIDFIRHFRSHTGEKPFKCKACVKSFSRNSNLVTHYKRIHNETEQYIERYRNKYYVK